MTKQKDYPRMVYHPTTGQYLICDTADKVPDGWCDSLADVSEPPKGSPARFTGRVDPQEFTEKKAKAPVKAKAKAEAKAKTKAKAKPSRLEVLNVTREELIAELTDAGVEVDPEASDDVLVDQYEAAAEAD